jgi:hypothetical protein
MTDKPASWSAASIGSIFVSLLCMAPTALTATLLVGLVLFNAVMFYMGRSSNAENVGWVMVYSLVMTLGTGFVSAPVVAAMSIVLHPIGAASAGIAIRMGARKSGGVLVAAHLITFLIGLSVAIVWTGLILLSTLG